jgi:hypothetical protein
MTRLVYRAPPRLLTETTPAALRPVRFGLYTRWRIVSLRQGPRWRRLWADCWGDLIFLLRG